MFYDPNLYKNTNPDALPVKKADPDHNCDKNVESDPTINKNVESDPTINKNAKKANPVPALENKIRNRIITLEILNIQILTLANI